MGTCFAPLAAELQLFCYEKDLMLSFFDKEFSWFIFEYFNSTLRYLYDNLTIVILDIW